MKPLILFLSLLLACGSCKNKVQAQDQESNSIVGKWELVGYVYGNDDMEIENNVEEKSENFIPADKATTITFYDDFRYENEENLSPTSECYYEGKYSLSERKENDGKSIRLVSITKVCLGAGSVTSDCRYSIFRMKNGDIHLHIVYLDSSDEVIIYKKI